MITLKKNSHLQNLQNKSILSLIILVAVMNINSLVAQVRNDGMLHISDNASFYVASGTFTFGTGSTTTTTRTASTYGKLVLNSGVEVSGAASGATLFTDGFVGTKSSSYVLPTGQTSTYAPIGVTNASVTNGVEAAYYLAAPATVGSNLFSTVSALSAAGYWVVKGDNATITLIWDSSLSSLASSITDLTVAGYNTSTSKWEAIASGTPSGTLTSGTLATASAVTLANYSAFTLAKKGIVSCADLVASSGNTRTWDGSSWSPSAPDISDPAVLAGPYASGSFICNSLDIGTYTITLTGDQTIEVVNDITGSGTITMSSESSILQRNDGSTITPAIKLTKSTRTGLFANDYIYWGSPLTSDSYSQLGTAEAFNIDNTSSRGAQGAFDLKYNYVSGDTSTSGGWQTLNSTVKGVGFIMRVKNQSPFSSTVNNSDHINLTFLGTTNNGRVDVTVKNITTNSLSSRNYNLLGNPYPSAIDALKFLEYNTNLDGVVYIWKAQTLNSGLAGVSYSANDYIAYTLAGSTGTGAAAFNGKIATGQGFKVKAITTTGTGTATFNNCMRVADLGSNGQLLRTKNTSAVDRYKLNLSGANGVGNQILIAYIPGTTLGYDRMYDAELNSVSASQLFSTTQNDSRKLAINARPTFEPTDVVNLGVSKSNATSENFTIAITDKEGIFVGNTVNVFLYDNLLNVYHNLANGAYMFNSATTALNNRFQIVYKDSALNNVDFETSSVFATITNQELKITSSLPMTNVAVYDISGRLITDFKVNSEKNATSNFLFADGIYIAKIKLNNGTIATQKLVNKK
jgi:hypothetical protein